MKKEEVQECTFHPQRITKNKDKLLLQSAEKDNKENINHFERLYMDYKQRAPESNKSQKKHRFHRNDTQSFRSSRQMEESAQRLHS